MEKESLPILGYLKMEASFYVHNRIETFFQKPKWLTQILCELGRHYTRRVPDAAQENTWSYKARPRRCAAQEKKQNKQVLLLAEPNKKQIIQNTHK